MSAITSLRPLASSMKKTRTAKTLPATLKTSLALRIADAIRKDVLAHGERPLRSYVTLRSLEDPAPTLGHWPCPAQPRTHIRGADEGMISCSVTPKFTDIYGSHTRPRPTRGDGPDGVPYPETSICSDFAVMERIDTRWTDGKRARVPAPEKLDEALQHALRAHKDIPNLSIGMSFFISVARAGSTSYQHVTVHVYSRFAPVDDPRDSHVDHNRVLDVQ